MSNPVVGSVALPASGVELTTSVWGSGTPEIVLLHDGLGSIRQWRDVPAALATATGLTVLAYDRAGHGASTPVPARPWPADWLHREAEVLAELIGALGITQPILVGHSDGGSIALIHAAAVFDEVTAVVALGAHSWVEPVCVVAITKMRAVPDLYVEVLADHHADAGALFDAWSGVWTSNEFGRWDIRPRLASVEAPVLVVQGSTDEYATKAMLYETAAAIGPNAHSRLVAGAGHLIHHQHPDKVVSLIASFVPGGGLPGWGRFGVG